MLRQLWYTVVNLVLYALSLGGYLFLEGRFRRGRFHNWSHAVRFRPGRFEQPGSEAEIVELVRSAESVCVVGAGHSFNRGLVTDGLLLSLDRYAGIVSIDRERMEVRVRAGTRVRDLSRRLWSRGLALAALPSHDAQSIGGLLSTDTHGTGGRRGFLSQEVRRLRLVDGLGEVLECDPGEDLFRAAVGGIGAAGVIVEAVLGVVERFHVEHRTRVLDVGAAVDGLERHLAAHDHVGLYMFPFSRLCQLNTWDRTERRRSVLGPLRESLYSALDALLAVTVANLAVRLRLLPRLATLSTRLRPNTALVLRSYDGFNQSIYQLSQSMEFAFRCEDAIEVWRRLEALYEERFRRARAPFTVIDLRFTPGGHDRTLIGGGRGRASVWIDLLSAPTAGWREFYDAAEAILRRFDGRPHLGKHTGSFGAEDLRRLHGESYERFLRVVERHDPRGRFATAYSRRFLAAAGGAPAVSRPPPPAGFSPGG